AGEGDPEAMCGLVLVAMGEADVEFDSARNIELLMRAACVGFAPALRCLGLAAEATGATEAARQWFALAWSRGDPVAVVLLACLSEDEMERQRLHALAASLGIQRSASRTCETVPLARIAVPDKLPTAPDSSCFDIREAVAVVHRERPRLSTHHDVFSELDCEYVLALAEPALKPSFVYDPRSGQPLRHPNRTSQSMGFPEHDGDLWLRHLQRRLARLAGLPLLNSERLAVLRYGVGEEYRPHRDYLRVGSTDETGGAGQRLTTAFCYLNDVESGGETDFPELHVRITPQRGVVVLFDNVDAEGRPDPSTLHAGMPVRSGEKWLATSWFRRGRTREF
ncbi:MAG: 2OG-Fe(II) oxygenase, partial [Dokdonella sp.]